MATIFLLSHAPSQDLREIESIFIQLNKSRSGKISIKELTEGSVHLPEEYMSIEEALKREEELKLAQASELLKNTNVMKLKVDELMKKEALRVNAEVRRKKAIELKKKLRKKLQVEMGEMEKRIEKGHVGEVSEMVVD